MHDSSLHLHPLRWIHYGGWPGNRRTVKENASKTVECVAGVCVCACALPALEQWWRGDPAMVIMC